ncbi:phage scaffolding protein [Bacillus sp. BP-3]|uniref:phage scaffolding protein n=1 Tax=Bacillus sp. BP-3 TaxID=3022773 RepID=UPI00232FEAF7|nr:phage scaffolding protein [Bacillus sp. BP-3]MDC2867569.1 phage scaffolding protein [Bacillus sp. BP-3]
MNKEQLIALGLTEEQADKVVEGFGNMIPKSRFDEKNSELKELKTQLQERDTQLEDLKTKAVGNEALTQKIEELTNLNKKTADEYQSKLDKQSFDFALKEALISANAKNPKAVEALLNRESIKLDGDKLTGLDEQLKAIQESDSYLFKQQEQQKPQFSHGQHQKTDGEPTTLAEALAERFSN